MVQSVSVECGGCSGQLMAGPVRQGLEKIAGGEFIGSLRIKVCTG
ncbi:MAG: hypothetical protein AAF282_20485 [Cyanobacteria bacterium P01_A01_bin.15]